MKRKGKHLVLRIFLVVLLAALVIFALGAWRLFGDIVTAANTVTQLESGLYALEFQGDYGFDDFLAQGGAASDAEVASYLLQFLSKGFYHPDTTPVSADFGCSTLLSPRENGGYVFGRNYDWEPCDAMIVHTKPESGYESISTCCLDFLGFGEDYRPDASMMSKIQSIAAVYVPLDGMNEAGLMVADLMAGDKEQTHQSGHAVDLTTTTAIRLLLDRAATVEEAIDLLGQYNMHSSIGSAHHLSIADKNGISVVVEYVDGQMLVTQTPVVTNHYLSSAKLGIGSEQSHQRFDTLMQYAQPTNSLGMLARLRSVAQFQYPQPEENAEKTMWSIAYDPQKNSAVFCFNEAYDFCYTLNLGAKSWVTPGTLTLPEIRSQAAGTMVFAENVTDPLPENCIFFSDAADSPYADRIRLTFSTDITDFRFLDMEYDLSCVGDLLCKKSTELFHQEKISAQDPVVLETTLGEILPVRGFSFTDAAGNKRTFNLFLSGKDGSPLVSEWDN